MATMRGGGMSMHAENTHSDFAQPARAIKKRQRVFLASFVFGIFGFVASVGDLIRQLLLTDWEAARPSTFEVKALAITATVFFVHAAFSLRTLVLAHKKGSI